MHESLKVYLKDSFVGWLSHETVGDEYSFEYNKDYLANPVEGAVLAPLYDLVSTVVYPELSREMAMGIGGEMRFSAITRANFSRMANDCGVSPKLVLSRLDALCGRVTTAAERLAEEFNASWPSGMYGKVIETINSHAAQVAS